MPRLCMILALLGALGSPALAEDSAALAAPSLAPPGNAAQVEPTADWNDTPAPEKEESRWYGDQILFANLLGVGTIVLGAKMESEGVLTLGILGTMIGSPIVHAANQQGTNMLISIPLHIALPIGGAALGVHALESCEYECHGPNFQGLLMGAALGVATATIIDAAFLARTRAGRRKSSRSVVPHVGVTGNGFSAGVGGTF